ncbi:MAG: hypothetical protein WKH64_03475 [Chloroflexia bacterium]
MTTHNDDSEKPGARYYRRPAAAIALATVLVVVGAVVLLTTMMNSGGRTPASTVGQRGNAVATTQPIETKEAAATVGQEPEILPTEGVVPTGGSDYVPTPMIDTFSDFGDILTPADSSNTGNPVSEPDSVPTYAPTPGPAAADATEQVIRFPDGEPMPNEEDWVRLEKSSIYLAPTTKQPKVSQSEAVEIARKRVKGIDPALTNPPPTHRYATNYAVGLPEEPDFMRFRLVWVVSFRIVNVVVGGDEAVDAPPNKTPRKEPTTAHVLVDSQTGEYILTVLAGERPEYVINLVCEPGVIETARKRWDAADVSSYDVVLQVRVFGPDEAIGKSRCATAKSSAERVESRSPRQSPEETLKAAEQFTVEGLFDL